MSQKVRVGVISTSGFAEWNLIPNTQSHQNAELLSVCGRRLDRATEVAKKHGINKIYTDYRELIRSDDLDAVIVGSPDDLHHEMVIEALSHGKHVFCEKPMASSVQQAKEMASLAQKQGVVNMVNFTWGWLPLYVYLKELLDGGTIGVPMYVSLGYKAGYGIENQGWRFDGDRAAGILGDLGAHLIHLVRNLFGDVKAVSANLRSFSAPRDHQTIPKNLANTSAALLLELESGLQAVLHATGVTMMGKKMQEHQIELAGTEGTLQGLIRFDKNKPFRVWLTRRDEQDTVELTIPDQFFGGIDRTLPAIDQISAFFKVMPAGPRLFIENISQGKSGKPDFNEGLQVQKVIDGAFKSDKEGIRVMIE